MVSDLAKWIFLPLKAQNILHSWLKGGLACLNNVKSVLAPISGFLLGSNGRIETIIKKGAETNTPL